MNFLNAIKHAAIGYGIRRTAWARPTVLLYLSDLDSELHWTERSVGGPPLNPDDTLCRLCGPDLGMDLSPDDLQACDWEVV